MSAPTKKLTWSRAHKRSISHSAQIKLLRFLVPMAGILILLTLFLWSPLENFFTPARLKEAINPQDLTLRNTVIKPTIHALDAHGRPYHLQADEAHQIAPETAFLTKPKGQIINQNGQKIHVDAHEGTYVAKDQTLDCQTQVCIRTSDGYQLEADQAKVNFPAQNATGAGHVNASGPTGNIEGSQGFFMTKEGHIHVPGPSKLVLK